MTNNHTTTTATHNSSHNTSLRRTRSMRVLVAAGAIAILAVAGCSTAQRRAFGEQDVRDALASHVEQAVHDQSLSLGGHLQCTSTIDAASHVSASCVGAATSGQAVTGTFTGSADINAETCRAALAIDIDSNRIVEQPVVQCFDSV